MPPSAIKAKESIAVICSTIPKPSSELQRATNFEPGAIPATFIHQLSRSRGRINAEVFQTITTDCHLKHPAVHQSTALFVLTMIRLLACSHARGPCEGFHECAKRLAYEFVALSPHTS